MDDVLDYSTDGFTTTDWSSFETTDGVSNDSSFEDGLFAGLFGGFLVLYICIFLAVVAVMIVSMWKIFTKAKIEGWKSIIPIYNTYTLYEMVGLKGWYVFLMFIPIVGGLIGLVFSIMSYINLSRSFGKDGGFAVGLILLPVVFLPMLAFGKDEYIGPNGIAN